MKYAKEVLEYELKSLKSREFPRLIVLFGGDKAHNDRIKDIEDALSILNGDIRESVEEFCTCEIQGINDFDNGNTCVKCLRLVFQNSSERT